MASGASALVLHGTLALIIIALAGPSRSLQDAALDASSLTFELVQSATDRSAPAASAPADPVAGDQAPQPTPAEQPNTPEKPETLVAPPSPDLTTPPSPEAEAPPATPAPEPIPPPPAPAAINVAPQPSSVPPVVTTPKAPARPRPAPFRHSVPSPVPLQSQNPVGTGSQGSARPSSAPSSAEPAAPASAAISPSWRSGLAAWLQQHKTYPERARARGQEGTVVVRFSLARDGRVNDVSVLHGSGSELLDNAAATLLRDAHVPPFPAEMPQQQATITLGIRYELER